MDDASKLEEWHAISVHERVVLPDHPVFVEGVAAPESTADGAGYRDAKGLVFRHDEAQPLRIHTSTRDQVARRKQQLSREVWRVALGFWVAGVLFIAVPLLCE